MKKITIVISDDCYEHALDGSYDSNDEIEAIYAIKEGEVIEDTESEVIL